MAEINWLALSEDPRKQTDKFGVVVDIPRMCLWEVRAGRARDIGVLGLELGLEAGPEPEPEAGYSAASRQDFLAERAMRCALLGNGTGD